MMHVIGNSHIMMFKHNTELFQVHSGGPATAHNLHKKNTTSESNEKLFDLVNSINKEKESIILVYGEIDCRIHIYYQFKKNQERYSISELIDATIENYGKVLKQLFDLGINFYICGIPPAGWESNTSNYPWYATPEIHCHIYKEFNTKLKQFCESNRYKYLDIYTKTVDDKGFIKREYAEDSVHLNYKALPIIIDLINKITTT